MSGIWFRVLEEQLTEALLKSPAWHRGVQQVHKKVHEIRHGKSEDDMVERTKITDPNARGFIEHFIEELKSGHKKEGK